MAGIPNYLDPFYANTWRYTEDPHIVNSDQWIDDAPQAYKAIQVEGVPDFYANGYSDTWKYTGMPHYAN